MYKEYSTIEKTSGKSIIMDKHVKEKIKGFEKYESVEKASTRFLSFLKKSNIKLDEESITLKNALDRVLATDLKSPLDIPPFKRAAMDGYAVISKDIDSASVENPAILEVIDRVSAGEKSGIKVTSGKTIAIATGAPMPYGANAVVMVENTSLYENNRVKIFEQIESGKNVASKGEDVKKGQILIEKGTLLAAQDIGIIASVGINKITVYKRPKVAVFSTGNELVEPGLKLKEGSIFESNRYMLSCLVKEFGGEVVDLGICPDVKDSIRRRLREALHYDIVVISGGSSVGTKDFVPEIIDEMGRPGILVHGVAMRPGSPTALAVVKKKPIISAPGYPVSAFFAFFTFGRPALTQMLRTHGKPLYTVSAEITKSVKLHKGMRAFLRVRLSKSHDRKKYKAEPISASGAFLLSTLTKSNGVIIIEDKAELKKGEKVQVIPLRNISDPIEPFS